MTRSFAAALLRASRLMRPARLTKATQSIRKATTSFMVKAALAPHAAAMPTTAKPRKAGGAEAGRPLGAVLRQLRAAQSLMPGAMAGSTGREVLPRIPSGAQYLNRKHRSAAGSRCCKIYLPATQPKRPKGLILMLHGCSQPRMTLQSAPK